MKKIKFAVVGYGNIGKRHVFHIQNNTDAILKAVCELPGTDRPELLPQEIDWYTDLELMLHDEDIDVVNICTPNYLHHVHTLAALCKGKHVVCEKPMAISSRQCDEMIECAVKNERTIFVVKQNRYNEPVQMVKKLLEQGILGRLFQIQVNCFWNRNELYYEESSWRGKIAQDGGCLFTQFSHFVDILFYLFGDVTDCHGLIKNFNHPYIEIEDSGTFYMHSESGAMVNFNYSTCSYEKNMEGAFTILAENGTVKIGGQYLNTIEYESIRDFTLPPVIRSSGANDYGKYQGSMSNHDLVIENVIQTLNGSATVMTNAAEGRKVVAIIEKMYAAANRNDLPNVELF